MITARAGLDDWVLLGVLALAGLVSDHLTARMGFILAAKAETDAVDVSVTTASVWIFVTIAIAPLYHVVLLAAFLTICGDLRIRWSRTTEKPLPPHRIVFNVGMTVTTSVAAGLVFTGMATDISGGLGRSGQVLVAGLLAYVVANLVQFLALGSVLMLVRGVPYRVPWGLLRDLSNGQLTLMSLGLLLAVAWRTDPLLILAGLPTVALLQQALLHHQLREAAAQDAKTGLASSSGWRQSAGVALARAKSNDGGLGVLVVDLDHFKAVNDTYGHLVGDQVLVAVADAMRSAVRSSDIVGRFGGEEFVVMLPNADRAAVAEVAERLRLAIAETEVALDGQKRPLQVTTSVGAALYPGDGYVLEDLLEQADRALYAAKHAGRNRVAFTEDAQVPEASELPVGEMAGEPGLKVPARRGS